MALETLDRAPSNFSEGGKFDSVFDTLRNMESNKKHDNDATFSY